MRDIDKIIRNVKTTLAVEGLEISKDAEDLGKKVLNEEITGDKAVESIKSKYLYKKNNEELKFVGFEREEHYV